MSEKGGFTHRDDGRATPEEPTRGRATQRRTAYKKKEGTVSPWPPVPVFRSDIPADTSEYRYPGLGETVHGFELPV